jgi:DNA repair protein RadC
MDISVHSQEVPSRQVVAPRGIVADDHRFTPARSDYGITSPTAQRLREAPVPYTLRSDAPEHMSDALLLARLLRRNLTEVERMLRAVGGLPDLARLTTGELMVEHGLTLHQAERLRLIFELGRRLPFPSLPPTHIRTPADVAALFLQSEPWEQEQLWVVLLTTRHAVISVETLYGGTLDRIVVRPAELFRSAIRQNAASIVVAHCHTSGVPEPSPEDVRLTREIIDLGRRLDLRVLDHLILGHGRWVSLREWRPALWTTAALTPPDIPTSDSSLEGA